MLIHINDINRGGLSDEVITKYQNTDKVKKYIKDILGGDVFPPIILYENTNTLADGIHRISAYLAIGIDKFEYIYH